MKFSIAYCIILALILQQCEGSFIKTVKKKIRNYLRGPLQASEFKLESGLEYPGNDPKLRQEIQKLWRSYYVCLLKKYKSLGPHKSVMPEAIMVFEGSSVRLACNVCVSPAAINTAEGVTWSYHSFASNETTLLEYGEHMLLSPQDEVLHMYNLQEENSGLYLCKVAQTVMAAYFLEVVNDSEPTVKVRPNTAPKGLHSQPPEVVPGYDFQVFTDWAKWSPCSKCGKVGMKVQSGICKVRLMQDNVLKNTSNIMNKSSDERENLKSSNETSANQTARTVKKETMQIMTLFKKGIPCRSSLLPPEIQPIPTILTRKSEVMTAFCKEPCPEESVFEVYDEKGKMLETANNSAGIYSTLQGIPVLPPPVARTTLYADTNTYRVTIRCPGNLYTDTPVQWQIGTKAINPILIERQSGGRIYIDMKNNIILKKPKPYDSNIYSCWQGKELAGTVRLVVVRTVKFNFNHHIALLGLVVITGSFVIVCYHIFENRRRALLPR